MTVAELIETLKRYDMDAQVFLGVQPNYPFKCDIEDVVSVRERISKEDRDGDDEDDDVFILQGDQITYASGDLWE